MIQAIKMMTAPTSIIPTLMGPQEKLKKPMCKLDSTILAEWAAPPDGNAGAGGADGGYRLSQTVWSVENMLKTQYSIELITHKSPSALIQRIVSAAKIKPCS